MAAVYELMGSTPAAARHRRRSGGRPAPQPQMDGFIAGRRITLQEGQKGTLKDLPDLPADDRRAAQLPYIRDVMAGNKPVPASIEQQVEHILQLACNMTHAS
jgi:hypothetical protein